MYFNTLKKLEEQEKQYLKEINSFVSEEKAEIKKAKAEIEEKYKKRTEEKYAELDKSLKEAKEYRKLITKYSTFEAKEIGTTIANLMSIFEGTSYTYQHSIPYKVKERTNLTFDYIEENKIRYANLVIKESYKGSIFTFEQNSLEKCINNQNTIILSSHEESDVHKIRFYAISPFRNRLITGLNFGEFSYVKDFIDFVISYRIKIDLVDISEEELNTLLIEFISQRKEQIEENYKKLEEQNLQQIIGNEKAKSEERHKKLQRILEKK